QTLYTGVDINAPMSYHPDICPQDEAMACTGTYIVKQADMDRGHVENTFTVSASSPGELDGPNVADSASQTVALPGTPSTTI
ncbi:unnamed protein product, partial [Ectocarpus sp. 12 AP-2014]